MLCLTCSNHFSILPFYVSIFFSHTMCVDFFNFIFMCHKYALYMFFISYTYLIFTHITYHILCTPSILCIYSTARLQIENKQTNKQTYTARCGHTSGAWKPKASYDQTTAMDTAHLQRPRSFPSPSALSAIRGNILGRNIKTFLPERHDSTSCFCICTNRN